MIDNADRTDRLIEKLRVSLPMTAMMSPECLDLFRKEKGTGGLPPRCQITRIDYAGDEGGIVCGLTMEGDVGKRVLHVSITHLRFDPRAPWAREISAYQKHRMKRLRRAA